MPLDFELAVYVVLECQASLFVFLVNFNSPLKTGLCSCDYSEKSCWILPMRVRCLLFWSGALCTNLRHSSYSGEKGRLCSKTDMSSNPALCIWQEIVGTLREFNWREFNERTVYGGVGKAKLLHQPACRTCLPLLTRRPWSKLDPGKRSWAMENPFPGVVAEKCSHDQNLMRQEGSRRSESTAGAFRSPNLIGGQRAEEFG